MQEHMHHEEMEHQGKGNHHEMMMKKFRKNTIIALIFTIPIILLSPTIQQWIHITLPNFGLNTTLLVIFSSIVVLYGAFPFFQGAIKSLKSGILDMDVLVSLAILSGYLYSLGSTFFFSATDFYREIATLVLFLLFGHRMEMRAVMGASGALNELAKLLPHQAHLIRDKNIIEIATDEIKIDDILLIRPGEKIPNDGKIIQGETQINESLLTGEAKPISKKIGDNVIGGTLNASGAIHIIIEKIGKDTVVAQIITLVKNAQESKPKTQKLADKAAHYLTLIAIIVGVLTFSYRYGCTTQGFVFALTLTITVFVIACPHALGLAIPTVTVIATTLAAKNGMLIKDMNALELARKLEYIVFDKTGTLTKGTFEVSDIISFGNWNEDEIIRQAAALEINSEHVIAKGIVNKAKEKNQEMLKVDAFQAIAGQGISGIMGTQKVYIGNEIFMSSMQISTIQAKQEQARLSAQGKTVSYIATQEGIQGIIALSDIIREESFAAIKSLQEMGIKVAMLTGDNEITAKYVAEKLALDSYFAQVAPGDKASKIKELQAQGYHVAMVGDGVNDAPALAQADVGIAIGAGTDIASASAEIILVKNNPQDITRLITLSKATSNKMVQNLVRATGYNVIAIPIAAGVLSTYSIMLQPEYAALIMAASSIIVVINALLLKKIKL